MIDRAGRDRLAECIHQLAAGVLTNRQFEDKGEFESADDATGVVARLSEIARDWIRIFVEVGISFAPVMSG